MPPKGRSKPSLNQKEGQIKTRGLWLLGFLHNSVRNVWLYVSIVLGLLTLYQHYTPDARVEVLSLDRYDVTTSLFTIANDSPWTFRNLQIKCTVSDGPYFRYSMSGIAIIEDPAGPHLGTEGVISLPPHQIATRDCGVNNKVFRTSIPDMEAIRVNIEVRFGWLFGLDTHLTRRHFSTRRVENVGYILVPDVEQP